MNSPSPCHTVLNTFELCDLIFKFVHDPDWPAELHPCALVSRKFSAQAQSHLFHTIDLPCHALIRILDPIDIATRLHRVLSAAPHLRALIRNLRVTMDRDTLRCVLDMHLAHVNAVHIVGSDMLDTNALTIAGELIALPTLHTVSISGPFTHPNSLSLLFANAHAGIQTVSIQSELPGFGQPVQIRSDWKLSMMPVKTFIDADRLPLKDLRLGGDVAVVERWLSGDHCPFDVKAVSTLRLTRGRWLYGLGSETVLDITSPSIESLIVDYGRIVPIDSIDASPNFTLLRRLQLTYINNPIHILSILPPQLPHLQRFALGLNSLDTWVTTQLEAPGIHEYEEWFAIDSAVASMDLPALVSFTLLINLSNVARMTPRGDWRRLWRELKPRMVKEVPNAFPEMYRRGVLEVDLA
ncbi:hypothetical protein R3P38DRAFT_3235975 [Favolaschia claudopus]|uniref:F-box domain-containing protein n=1 Tax=Favolaschia claudopus TaxID=2862362 RepID=A0AAV9ZEM5_9AGAR